MKKEAFRVGSYLLPVCFPSAGIVDGIEASGTTGLSAASLLNPQRLMRLRGRFQRVWKKTTDVGVPAVPHSFSFGETGLNWESIPLEKLE